MFTQILLLLFLLLLLFFNGFNDGDEANEELSIAWSFEGGGRRRKEKKNKLTPRI